MALSSIVHNPIVDPQICDARQRYTLTHGVYHGAQQTWNKGMRMSYIDPQGHLLNGNGQQIGFRDAQGYTWVCANRDARFETFVSVGDGGNGQPSVTVMRMPIGEGYGKQMMTIAPASAGYQISETEFDPADRAPVRTSNYGLTPYGAVEGGR